MLAYLDLPHMSLTQSFKRRSLHQLIRRPGLGAAVNAAPANGIRPDELASLRFGTRNSVCTSFRRRSGYFLTAFAAVTAAFCCLT